MVYEGSKTELLAVSLKKPGDSKKAILNEFSIGRKLGQITKKVKFKYDGFSLR